MTGVYRFMTAFPAQPLQAALLFADPDAPAQRRPDWDALARAVKAHPAMVGDDLVRLSGSAGSRQAVLATSDLTARIELRQTPLPLAGFAVELGHVLYTRHRPELSALVRSHGAALLVEVARRTPRAPDTTPLPPEDQPAFDRRLMLTAALSATLARQMSPSVVHWAQSNQLFLGAEFTGLAQNPFPLSLFVQPGIFAGAKRADGSRTTGIDGHGAAHLIGQHVVFQPHPQDSHLSYLALLAFVDACRYARRLPRKRTVFGAEGAPPIEVTLHPGTQHHPAGIISLDQRDTVRPGAAPTDAPIQGGDASLRTRLQSLATRRNLRIGLIVAVVLVQVLAIVSDSPLNLTRSLTTRTTEMNSIDAF